VRLVLALALLALMAVPALAGASGPGLVVEEEGDVVTVYVYDGPVLAASLEARAYTVDGVPVDLSLTYRAYTSNPPVTLLVLRGEADGAPFERVVQLSGTMYRTVRLSTLLPGVVEVTLGEATVVAVSGGGAASASLDGHVPARYSLGLGRDYFEVRVSRPWNSTVMVELARDSESLGTLTLSWRTDHNGTVRAVGLEYRPGRLEDLASTPILALHVCHEAGNYTFNLTRGARLSLPGPVPEGRVDCMVLEAVRGVYRASLDLAGLIGDPIVLGLGGVRVVEESGFNVSVLDGALLVVPEAGLSLEDLVWANASCGQARVPGAPGPGGVVFPVPGGCDALRVWVESGTPGARRVYAGVVGVPEGVVGAVEAGVRPAILVVSRGNLEDLTRLGAPPGVWGVVGGLGAGSSVVYIGASWDGRGVLYVEVNLSVVEELAGGVVFSGVAVGGGGYGRVLVDASGGGGLYTVRASTFFEERVDGVYIVVSGGVVEGVEGARAVVYGLGSPGVGENGWDGLGAALVGVVLVLAALFTYRILR